MRKFRVHIKAETEDRIKEELRELAYIAVGLRESQKKWGKEFGSVNKKEMKKWEARMDDWINKYKVFYNGN